MKFTTSTKPLIEGLNLGILNANVTKFYSKSTMAQVSATKDSLTINIEASLIYSEIRLKGAGDSDESAMIFVDSLLLKQLVNTFETSTVTFEFNENELVLHSGKSTFALPKTVDADIQFTRPTDINTVPDMPVKIDIDKAGWKFIKDHQLYALGMSFVTPVYTKAWIGSEGDVLVGDYDNSLFTHSKKSKLGQTCLLSDTIINLFDALPEGAELDKLDKTYVIRVVTDSYTFISEFTPKYESDEDMGSYNSDIILSMMNPSKDGVVVEVSNILKVLNQADILSTGSDSRITLSVSTNQITLKDANVDCMIAAKGEVSEPYEVQFKTAFLKSVISNSSEQEVTIYPTFNGEEIVGVNVSSNDLTTVLAGVE